MIPKEDQQPRTTREELDFTTMSGVDLLDYCRDDASKWAEAFCQIKQRQGWSADDIDEGLMVGWFANAIEHSSDVRRLASRQEASVEELVANQYDNCPTCHLGWKLFPPTKINNVDAVRCVECKAVYPLASRQEVSVTVEELATLLIDCWKSGKAPLQVARALLAKYSITKRTTEG